MVTRVPRFTIQNHQAQTQFENQKLQEFVSHLLCLNSRDQLSQQVPTHLSSSILLSNTQTAGVMSFALRGSPSAEAHYTAGPRIGN